MRLIPVLLLLLSCSTSHPQQAVDAGSAADAGTVADAGTALQRCGGDADSTCTPSEPLANQERTTMRDRCVNGAVPTMTTVADMLQWPAPARASDPAARAADAPIDDRELQSYFVEVDIQHVRFEGSDCDLHVEASAPGAGPSAPRILVEIPTGAPFEPARMAIWQAAGHQLKPDEPLDFNPPVHARLTGFAYYDSFYWTASDPRLGSGHGSQFVGTLWELHPVWKIDLLTP